MYEIGHNSDTFSPSYQQQCWCATCVGNATIDDFILNNHVSTTRSDFNACCVDLG